MGVFLKSVRLRISRGRPGLIGFMKAMHRTNPRLRLDWDGYRELHAMCWIGTAGGVRSARACSTYRYTTSNSAAKRITDEVQSLIALCAECQKQMHRGVS